MKREIKFRGKRLDNGEWVYGLLHYSYGTGIWSITCSDGWVPSYNNPDEGEGTVFHEVDFKSIGQFTGLPDKNGKEIYEGDIVMAKNLFYPSKVIFEDGSFLFGDITFADARSTYAKVNWEVIGNIYENESLLTNNNQL